jgi:hypothetical protein
MLTILNYAQALVYTLMDLMPSKYQQKSLRALLGLFLEATGQSLPQHSQTVSASAISRFLNHYQWSVRGVIRVERSEVGFFATGQPRTAKGSASSVARIRLSSHPILVLAQTG